MLGGVGLQLLHALLLGVGGLLLDVDDLHPVLLRLLLAGLMMVMMIMMMMMMTDDDDV